MANNRNRNRFVDHTLFLLAAKAFQDSGLESAELISVRDRLLKIILSDFYAELDAAIYSLADQGIRVMKNRLERQAERPKNLQTIWDHVEVLEDTMIQLRIQQDLFAATFPGKASMNAMKVARAAGEDDPAAKLAQYASIPMLTGQLKLKNWISDAAQVAGAPISDNELEINEASTATNLGSDLLDAEKDLLLAPPNSRESAEASDRKAQILQEIEETRKDARSRNNILGLVSAAATPQEVYTQKTKVGRELGMGSNMERAMLAEGKVMIAAGAGAGKCITGDTLVQTEHGFIPIGEFASNLGDGEDAPLSLTIHGKDGLEKTSDIYNDGIRATRRITTSQGYELEGTEAHKIQILRNGNLEWATLGDIAEGDVAVIDRRPGLFAEKPFQRKPLDPNSFHTNATPDTSVPLDLTPQVASLLGWIVSEGYIRRSRWQIALSTTDPEQRDAYLAAMEGLIQPTESLDDRNRRQYVLTFSRSADIQALMGFGLTRTLAGEKEIPFGVLRSPKPVVTAFLRSLFDGDGGATTRSVEYCTASNTLASQVHTLLTAFGIPSKKKFRENAGQGAWHIIIGGLGLRKFASEIGFGLKSKQTRLEAIVATTSNTNIDVIPGVESLCAKVKEAYAAENGSARTNEERYGTFKCIVNGSRRPSFDTLNNFLAFYNIPECAEWRQLKTLATSSWFFDPIVEIEDGEACVYDFVVPKTHSFSAGGFINHNTRLLAGKVTYLIKEQGVHPDQIIAVSFTKKSAVELARRIEEYGVAGASKMRSFATINSLGLAICNRYGLARGKELIKSWDEQKLIRMAIQQVTMKSDSPTPPNPKMGLLGAEPGFWNDTAVQPSPVAPPTPAPATPAAPTGNQFRQVIDDLRQINNSNPSREWREKTEGFLNSLYRYNSADRLSGPQLKWLRGLMDRGGIRVKGINASLTESVELDDNFLDRLAAEVRNRVAATEMQAAADRMVEASQEIEGAAPSALPQASNAEMWFNKGWEPDKIYAGGGENRGNIKPGDVARYIAQKTGSLISPDKAFTELGSQLGDFVWNEELRKNEFQPYQEAFLACAYGAFLWLKGNHENFKHTMSFDDQILLAANALRNRPDIRADMQKRIKHLIVDECQDANKAQQVLFGLMAGTLDPATMEDYDDNRIAINTFMQIGDDKQCLDSRSVVMTPEGEKVLADLKAGDSVISYRNGKLVAQTVKHAKVSSWTEGLKVTLESGKTLTMSPNHKLWATAPVANGEENIVYLMHRDDMGYRVGISKKSGQRKRGEGYYDSLGGRAFMEKADRMWVLGICKDREDALLEEETFSLTYGVPTACFNGKHRSLNQDRINSIFERFGQNGSNILADKNLAFSYPHWTSQSYSKHERNRLTIHLTAHTSQGTLVSTEWSDPTWDSFFDDVPPSLQGNIFTTNSDGRRRFRRYFDNYRQALALAEEIAEHTGALLTQKISLPEGPLTKITASGLFPGMEIPTVVNDEILLDQIISIEAAPGTFIDLDVEDASNFIANNILTSNSIYGFRGATPNEFIKRSDLKGGGFKTHLLDTNYRSGGMIVGAANALMEHQKLDGKNVQVPMTCNVKASSEGQGTIVNVRPLTPASAVEYVADNIQNLLDSGTETLGDAAETTFGIVTRTNGEATDYAMALIKRGIVFRMKKRYHPLLQSTIRNGASLMRLAAKNTSAKDLDEALLFIIQNFVAGLGKTFIEKMQRSASGTLINFFLSGEWRKVAGKSSYWRDACESMIPFITALREMADQELSPAMLLDSIMNLPMPGDTRNSDTGVNEDRLPIRDHLIKQLKQDIKATADLMADHMDDQGNVPDHVYEDAALAPVTRLFKMASDFANTEQFLSYYDELVKISEKTFVESNEDKEDVPTGAVILDTVHQWKGLEAKHVFIPAIQGVFPPNEAIPGEKQMGRVVSPKELLEERRLMYVAITRGKESVTTLSPLYRDLDGEKPIPLNPSRFIQEACIPSSVTAKLPPVPEDDDNINEEQYKAYMEG